MNADERVHLSAKQRAEIIADSRGLIRGSKKWKGIVAIAEEQLLEYGEQIRRELTQSGVVDAVERIGLVKRALKEHMNC